jgi:ribosomal protein L13E
MPAQRLGSNPVAVRKCDVAGQDSATKRHFVRHVGLVNEERNDVRAGTQVPLVHMGPPLERQEAGIAVHAVATAGLTAGQIRQMGVFVDEHVSEYEAERLRPDRQYVIHPHVREPDDVVPCRRFSCAGFVIEAHGDAGIELLVTEPADLPPVNLDTLIYAYPDAASQLRSPTFRSRLGLEGDGPWPVVLVGYVLNSLSRTVDEIRRGPYTPVAGDEFFPAQPPSEASPPARLIENGLGSHFVRRRPDTSDARATKRTKRDPTPFSRVRPRSEQRGSPISK